MVRGELMFSLVKKIKSSFFRNRDYEQYIKLQRDRSLSKYHSTSKIENERKEFFVSLLGSLLSNAHVNEILVIGCRNTYELDLLSSMFSCNVIGVDLFSRDKRVKVMDMHCLEFGDYFFDIVYCSHSLEHAYDYNKVISEVVRVLKNDGYIAIEVPVNYKTQGSDIHDFISSANIKELFAKHVNIKNVLYESDLLVGEEENFCGTDVSRVVYQINKS
jgi:SAM-dependent methyltransferase